MPDLKIEAQNGPGKGKIWLDGHEISRFVRDVHISVGATHAPVVTLELIVRSVDVDSEVMPANLRVLIKKHGA